MPAYIPAYHMEDIKRLRTFLQFDKYMLRRKGYRREMKIRYYHSRAEGTIKSYTRVIKSYVKYMHRKEDASPFPVTEGSLRRYIDSLDLYRDRSKFAIIKPAMIFVKKVRNDPEISFNSMDLVLEGLLREVGARFRKKIKTDRVNELNVRKLLLRGLYGSSFREPYNENMVEFRTALRALTSLFCLSRCLDFMELKRCDIEFEEDNVIIIWRKRKNNQKSKPQVSLVPKLPQHPLCLYRAFRYYFERTNLGEDQFVNCKWSKRGRAHSDHGISRSTCYENIRKLCATINIDQVTKKMCKSLGTR